MHVKYNQSNIVGDLSLKIYPEFHENGYRIHQVKLGQGNVYFFSMNEFYDSTMNVFKDDLYAYVKTPLEIKPYLL